MATNGLFRFIKLVFALSDDDRQFYEVEDRTTGRKLGAVFQSVGTWRILGDPVGPPRFTTRYSAAHALLRRNNENEKTQTNEGTRTWLSTEK